MTKQLDNIRAGGISRILLELGAWDSDDELMKSAINLASRLQAELCGLFVEDIDLLHAANLPFTQEISLLSAQARKFDAASVVQHLQSEAGKLRQQMESLAKISRVNCSFRIARGIRFNTIFEEGLNFELLILTPTNKPYLSKKKSVQIDFNKPLVLFYDELPQSKRALQVVQLLASNGLHGNISVLTTNEFNENEARKHLLDSKQVLHFERLAEGDISSIINYSKMSAPGLVVIPLEEQLMGQMEKIKELLNVLSCPLILVR
ncbi:MAG: hypothetical protein OEY89_09920 [Gammaproteobacteria bacterium]|nr:hypothetical protein [Gammaproteobacteria bacterium]